MNEGNTEASPGCRGALPSSAPRHAAARGALRSGDGHWRGVRFGRRDGLMELMPRGAVVLTLLMTFKNAVFTCDQ